MSLPPERVEEIVREACTEVLDVYRSPWGENNVRTMEEGSGK